MHIARVAGLAEDVSWALVDAETQSVRRIRTPFGRWAGRVASEGEAVLEADAEAVPFSKVRLRAPVQPGARVFGVGLNYLEHLTRLGRTEAPPHTIAYIKPDSAIVDPGGEITYPAVTATLDFEIELVAVVGRPLREEARASECLLGYTIGNDVSARDAGKQLGSLDLFTQKALDSTAPIGPWIATLDACGGPGQPELDIEMHEAALELLGPRAELDPSSAAAGDVGDWLDGYIFALSGPIYAGTNQIQRNIIAERILGLPRK